MVYEGFKVYGPYTRKDFRQIVILSKDHKKRTVSYPKFLLEKHLGRYLFSDETVDHIDGDFNNNEIINLRVMNRNLHSGKHVRRLKKQSFECPMCGSEFVLDGSKLSTAIFNRKRGKSGPFCSRRCIGIYGQLVQKGKEKIPVSIICGSYYNNHNTQSLLIERLEVDPPNSGKP